MNLDAAKLAAHVGDLIETRKLPIAGAMYSAVLIEDGKRWAPIYSTLCFASQAREARPTRKYPSTTFTERWLSVADALKAIQGMATPSGSEFSAPLAENQSIHVRDDRIGDGSRNGEPSSGWPEWRFDVSTTGRGLSGAVEPFVAVGAPPFRYEHEAVQDWLWSSTRDSPFRNSPMGMIILPDFRGRLRSIDWADDRLAVSIETEASMEPLVVQAVAEVDGTRVTLPERAAAATTSFDMPPRARSVQVFLVHQDGSCLGIVERHQRGRELGGGVRSLEEQAVADIAAGEGESVEFKPFIDAGHAKEYEVLKTAVAFANTDGGRIYLGVTDGSELQGDAALRKAGGGSSEQARLIVSKHVDKLIRDKTKPVPFFTTRWAQIHGEPVLVVEIEPSRRHPVSTHENDIFVRKGATNRRPDPSTELRSMYFRDFTPRFGEVDEIDADDLDARELK